MNRLKMLRVKSGITLRDLEKYVDIRNATLSQIENGKQPFREVHVKKLTSFFDVSSDYLLGYSNTGIGIYFLEDHAVISASELEKIAEENVVSEDILQVGNSEEFTIIAGGKQTTLYRNKYVLHRSVDIFKENAPISVSLREQIDTELSKLGTKELEKVLKFINEYIK